MAGCKNKDFEEFKELQEFKNTPLPLRTARQLREGLSSIEAMFSSTINLGTGPRL
jgi:hypothetical protein